MNNAKRRREAKAAREAERFGTPEQRLRGVVERMVRDTLSGKSSRGTRAGRRFVPKGSSAPVH